MRLAVYNVENLFDRAKVMNLESWSDGRKVLEDFSSLNKPELGASRQAKPGKGGRNMQ